MNEVLTDGLLTRAADQLFSLSILLIVAWVLWKRLSKVEDKMDKYLTEDREKMIDVLRENSQAMHNLRETIKNKHVL